MSKEYPPVNFASVEQKELVLDVLSFAIAEQINLINPTQLTMQINELPERMSRQFIARFRLPGEVKQDNRLIASYPKRGILNAIRFELSEWGERFPRALGWLQRVRPVMVEHRMWQAIVYPELPVHRDLEKVRIFYQTNMAEVP